MRSDPPAPLQPYTRASLVILGVMMLLLAIEGSLHFRYTPDDSFIYFQYARNLVDRGEIAFNPGEPANGITGPAWMFLSAASYVVVGDPVFGTKLLDILLAVLSIPVFHAVARSVLSYERHALLATVCFAANAWFIRWAGSGMETSAAVLFSCVLLGAVLSSRVIVSFVLLGILVLLRPEAILFGPLVFLYLLGHPDGQSRRWRTLLLGPPITAGIVLSWSIYAYAAFGNLLPNTRAKSAWNLTLTEFAETFMDIAKTLVATDGILLAILLLILPAALLRSRGRSLGVILRRTDLRRIVVLSCWIGIVLLFYVVSGTNVVSRYLLLVFPALLLLVFCTWEWFVGRYSGRFRYLANVALAATALYVIQNQAIYWIVIDPGIMAFQQGMESTFIHIGKWAKANTPEGSRVLIGDIGAVGYFAERPIDDAGGLVSAGALPILRTGVQPYDMIASGAYRTWADPDYIVHRGAQPEVLVPNDSLDPLFAVKFRRLSLQAGSSHYYTVYQVLR